MPLVRRTRATLRSAEFGFFGVCVNTRTQTPRFCGLSCSTGLFVFVRTFSRPLRTSWLIVGTVTPRGPFPQNQNTPTTQAALDIDVIHGAARNRFVAPGLGNREAVRHLKLTYPIRFSSAGLQPCLVCAREGAPPKRERLFGIRL